MNSHEFRSVVDRYPELKAGLTDHFDEVVRIANRIIEAEKHLVQPPDLPGDAPGWERAYWERRREAA